LNGATDTCPPRLRNVQDYFSSCSQGCSSVSPWHSLTCSGLHSPGFPFNFSGCSHLHSHLHTPLSLPSALTSRAMDSLGQIHPRRTGCAAMVLRVAINDQDLVRLFVAGGRTTDYTGRPSRGWGGLVEGRVFGSACFRWVSVLR